MRHLRLLAFLCSTLQILRGLKISPMLRFIFLLLFPVFVSAQKLDTLKVAIQMPYGFWIDFDYFFNENGGKGNYSARSNCVNSPILVDKKIANYLYALKNQVDSCQSYDGVVYFKQNGKEESVPPSDGYSFLFYFNSDSNLSKPNLSFFIDNTSKNRFPKTILMLKSFIKFMILTIKSQELKEPEVVDNLKRVLIILKK